VDYNPGRYIRLEARGQPDVRMAGVSPASSLHLIGRTAPRSGDDRVDVDIETASLGSDLPYVTRIIIQDNGRGDLDDEVGVEGCGDPFDQRDGGDP
jgi:hypothetical protein